MNQIQFHLRWASGPGKSTKIQRATTKPSTWSYQVSSSSKMTMENPTMWIGQIRIQLHSKTRKATNLLKFIKSMLSRTAMDTALSFWPRASKLLWEAIAVRHWILEPRATRQGLQHHVHHVVGAPGRTARSLWLSFGNSDRFTEVIFNIKITFHSKEQRTEITPKLASKISQQTFKMPRILREYQLAAQIWLVSKLIASICRGDSINFHLILKEEHLRLVANNKIIKSLKPTFTSQQAKERIAEMTLQRRIRLLKVEYSQAVDLGNSAWVFCPLVRVAKAGCLSPVRSFQMSTLSYLRSRISNLQILLNHSIEDKISIHLIDCWSEFESVTQLIPIHHVQRIMTNWLLLQLPAKAARPDRALYLVCWMCLNIQS